VAIVTVMVAVMTVITVMSAVTAMHEEMHQWAGEEEQPGKPPQEVGPMLGDEIEASNDEKADKYDIGAKAVATLLAGVVVSVIHPRLLYCETLPEPSIDLMARRGRVRHGCLI